MRSAIRRVLPVAMLVSAILWASSAMAAPLEWQRVDVTIHSEQSSGVMIVSGDLPETAKLPAQAELSVPAGSKLQWIGEILGGDPSADTELQYTKSTVAGSDIYRFTLTKARTAQLEIVTSGAAPFNGTTYSPTLTWTATQAVPEVRLIVRIPQGAQILQTVPGAELEPGDAGNSYYTKTTTDVKPGDQLDLAFTYQVAAAPASGASSASSGSTAQILLIILFVAGGIGVTLAVRRKMTPGSSVEPEPVATSAKNTRKKSGSSAAAKSGERTAPAKATQSAGTRKKQPEVTVPQTPRVSGASKRNLVTGIIVGSLVLIALVVGKQASKPQIEGDSITQTFSQGQPCSTAMIDIAVPADADPTQTAEKLFAALKSVGGMNTATYNSRQSTLEAGFCESKATEEAVRAALAPTGLVSASAPAAAPAPTAGTTSTPAAGPAVTAGSEQVLSVDTASGSFSPSQLTARAGEPIAITFGQGSGCIAEVVFPDLNIRQSLEGGPVTVKLPALDAGTYSFACGMDMQHGTLVVQ